MPLYTLKYAVTHQLQTSKDVGLLQYTVMRQIITRDQSDLVNQMTSCDKQLDRQPGRRHRGAVSTGGAGVHFIWTTRLGCCVDIVQYCDIKHHDISISSLAYNMNTIFHAVHGQWISPQLLETVFIHHTNVWTSNQIQSSTWHAYSPCKSCTLLVHLLFVSSTPQSQHCCKNLSPTTEKTTDSNIHGKTWQCLGFWKTEQPITSLSCEWQKKLPVTQSYILSTVDITQITDGALAVSLPHMESNRLA